MEPPNVLPDRQVHSVPKLSNRPRPLPGADFKRAAAADSARQEGFGVKKTYPAWAQLLSTQMRFMVAGELAKSRGSF